MDVSARTTLKGAAKCDKHCELQDSVNQQKVERMLPFRVFPESMFASLSFVFSAGRVTQVAERGLALSSWRTDVWQSAEALSPRTSFLSGFSSKHVCFSVFCFSAVSLTFHVVVFSV